MCGRLCFERADRHTPRYSKTSKGGLSNRVSVAAVSEVRVKSSWHLDVRSSHAPGSTDSVGTSPREAYSSSRAFALPHKGTPCSWGEARAVREGVTCDSAILKFWKKQQFARIGGARNALLA